MDLTVLLSCVFGVSNLSRPPTSCSLVTHQKCFYISQSFKGISVYMHTCATLNFLMTQRCMNLWCLIHMHYRMVYVQHSNGDIQDKKAIVLAQFGSLWLCPFAAQRADVRGQRATSQREEQKKCERVSREEATLTRILWEGVQRVRKSVRGGERGRDKKKKIRTEE